MLALTEAPIDAEAVRRAVATPAAGAVVVFHGTVRDRTKGRGVRWLEYEAYPPMALTELGRIAEEVTRAHGLLGLACVHRVGRLELGEAAVVLAAAAPHRKAALDAVEDFVVRLKRDVPIWKREVFEDGAVWVGTPDDPQGERAPRAPGPGEGAR
jgi:molybdopterin synthase catalytic subunit